MALSAQGTGELFMPFGPELLEVCHYPYVAYSQIHYFIHKYNAALYHILSLVSVISKKPYISPTLQNMSINLDHPMLSGETTVQNAVTEVAAMVGENVKLRRGFMLSTTAHGVVSSYMHTCPQPGDGISVFFFSRMCTLYSSDFTLPD
jgi:hypothetical protein